MLSGCCLFADFIGHQYITYLSNIRIAYSDGLLESTRIVDVEEMDDLLADVIEAKSLKAVKESK